MKKLLVFVLATGLFSCRSSLPDVGVWTGWQVNTLEDFDALTPEEKERVVAFGKDQLKAMKIPCWPPPKIEPLVREDEGPLTREKIQRIVTDLLLSWNPDLSIDELEYELHECINGQWVCKLPITLQHRGTPFVRTVNVGGTDIELLFDVTFVWTMDDR